MGGFGLIITEYQFETLKFIKGQPWSKSEIVGIYVFANKFLNSKIKAREIVNGLWNREMLERTKSNMHNCEIRYRITPKGEDALKNYEVINNAKKA